MAKEKKKDGIFTKFIMLVGGLVWIWVIWKLLFGGGFSFTQEAIDPASRQSMQSARFECRWAIEATLKDPNSAEWVDFNSWPASFDDPLMTVAATVRAKNGFGGYVVEQFLCEMVTSDGRDFSRVNVVQ